MGGIYALERLAKDSPQDHWTIMEVLSAYVRRNAPAPSSLESESGAPYTSQRVPRTDIQAIVTVLGRRKRGGPWGQPGQRIELSLSDLRGLDLCGARLENVSLLRAHLEGASLCGAHLEGARLYEARLEGAYLVEAHLDNADLTEANLERTILHETHLQGANLWATQLTGAQSLTVARIKAAKDWEWACYSSDFRAELGLSPEGWGPSGRLPRQDGAGGAGRNRTAE